MESFEDSEAWCFLINGVDISQTLKLHWNDGKL